MMARTQPLSFLASPHLVHTSRLSVLSRNSSHKSLHSESLVLGLMAEFTVVTTLLAVDLVITSLARLTKIRRCRNTSNLWAESTRDCTTLVSLSISHLLKLVNNMSCR